MLCESCVSAGSIPKHYEEIAEAQEAIDKASTILKKTKDRLDRLEDHAVLTNTHPSTNEELMAHIIKLNKRIEMLELEHMQAKREHVEAYAGLKRTLNQLACGGLAGAIARTSVSDLNYCSYL